MDFYLSLFSRKKYEQGRKNQTDGKAEEHDHEVRACVRTQQETRRPFAPPCPAKEPLRNILLHALAAVIPKVRLENHETRLSQQLKGDLLLHSPM